tara:strand:+ start:3197 stop:3370 length:174 start_codon:yes stop_codon:yes gene_type:complete
MKTYNILLATMFILALVLNILTRVDELFLFYWISMVALLMIGCLLAIEFNNDKPNKD